MTLARSTKGFLLALVVLLMGMLFSVGKEPFFVVVISVFTTVVMVYIIQKNVRGDYKEIVISGFILGAVETYVYLIQPNYPGAPALPGAAELFFGIAFLTRASIYVLEIINNPLRAPIRRFLSK